MKRLATLLAATGALAAGIAFAQAPLVVYSAGSLRATAWE